MDKPYLAILAQFWHYPRAVQEDALSAVNLILREGNQGQFPKGAG